jgi:hypothetical protein
LSYTGDADLREHLSAFRPLLALSMVMTDTADEDEIIRLATTAIPSLGPFRAEAVCLDGAWWPGVATGELRAPYGARRRHLCVVFRAR